MGENDSDRYRNQNGLVRGRTSGRVIESTPAPKNVSIHLVRHSELGRITFYRLCIFFYDCVVNKYVNRTDTKCLPDKK